MIPDGMWILTPTSLILPNKRSRLVISHYSNIYVSEAPFSQDITRIFVPSCMLNPKENQMSMVNIWILPDRVHNIERIDFTSKKNIGQTMVDSALIAYVPTILIIQDYVPTGRADTFLLDCVPKLKEIFKAQIVCTYEISEQCIRKRKTTNKQNQTRCLCWTMTP